MLTKIFHFILVTVVFCQEYHSNIFISSCVYRWIDQTLYSIYILYFVIWCWKIWLGNHKDDFLVALITLVSFRRKFNKRKKERKKNYELRDCFTTFNWVFLWTQKRLQIKTLKKLFFDSTNRNSKLSSKYTPISLWVKISFSCLFVEYGTS